VLENLKAQLAGPPGQAITTGIGAGIGLEGLQFAKERIRKMHLRITHRAEELERIALQQ